MDCVHEAIIEKLGEPTANTWGNRIIKLQGFPYIDTETEQNTNWVHSFSFLSVFILINFGSICNVSIAKRFKS